MVLVDEFVSFIVAIHGAKSLHYIGAQPPLKLFGQTGLGHCPSLISSSNTEVPIGQLVNGGRNWEQNAT